MRPNECAVNALVDKARERSGQLEGLADSAERRTACGAANTGALVGAWFRPGGPPSSVLALPARG